MKRLVICFDGSWNRLDAQYSTNVVITAESVVPIARDGISQVIFYDEGVGTGKWDNLRGGIFGIGLVQNLADAYRFLIFNYTPGDQIYIFGFSRGAFTARSFAGLLSNSGILKREHASKVKQAITKYQERGNNSLDHTENMMRFRQVYSRHICVSKEEDEWRVKNIKEYKSGSSPLLQVTYLGVWDTVGSLGIPRRYAPFKFINRKHEFHDTALSSFVKSARHAVAIDERRRDFQPTLWSNVDDMNIRAGANSDAVDAPYQQKWFPGTHGSVGGGGDRRGLSDQALDWVLDGARLLGLDLDIAEGSRIFELAPNYREYLFNSSMKPGIITKATSLFPMNRVPGPLSLSEVSISARRRWHEKSGKLRDGFEYKPPTLSNIAGVLNALDPVTLGIGVKLPEKFQLHTVINGETLSHLSKKYYGDARGWKRIFEANRDKIEDHDHIYTGQVLRIPGD